MKKAVSSLVLTLVCVCVTCLASCLFFPTGDGAIRFYVDGELYQTVTPREDGSFDTPEVAVPSGYSFDGWFCDEHGASTYQGGAYAYGFLRPIPYTITYELDGGEADNPVSFTVESDSFTLTAPIKRGYTFLGWTGDGLDGVAAHVTVPKGTVGDFHLTATYAPTEYTITYELDGGEASNPTAYTVESDSFTVTPPSRTGSEFLAWEKDGVLYETYTVAQGTVGDITLRAVWRTGQPVFTYQADIPDAFITSSARAGNVESGMQITVCAPAVQGDKRFVGWKCNGLFATCAVSYTFTMGDDDRNLIACYEDSDAHVYDKAEGGALTLSTDHACEPYALYGGGAFLLTDVSYGRGYARLDASYLSSLPEGDVWFYVDDAWGGAWFLIRVTDTSERTRASILYDTDKFPAAVLDFDCSCGGEHTYSLDGAAPVACRSGDVLTGYRKDWDHTLRLTCSQDGKVTQIVREGYDRSHEVFYTDSFTYGGRTYDLMIESEEEYSILFDYLIAVRGVLDYTADPSAPLEYAFYVSDDLAAALDDDMEYERLTTLAFSSKSFPMSPTIGMSYHTADIHRYTLTIEYPYGLNTQLSTQKTVILQDTASPEESVGRPADYNTFPIDAYPPVTVRTLYELELLPYGVRPVFDDPASDAAKLYERARSVLRTIVDDSMNEYQKTAAIYRYLACHVTYDDVAYASANASVYRSFTAYGALMDGVAVCDGYAGAFRLLCQIEDIACEEYSGRNDPDDPTSGHAWNKYTIDGVTYACDVTWARVDDTYVTMFYLMMDEDVLLQTGHYENAAEENSFTQIVADGEGTYYERFETALGYDLDISSYDEFLAAVQFGYARGMDVLELRVSVGDLSVYLNRAANDLRRNLSAFRTSNDVCYIIYTT